MVARKRLKIPLAWALEKMGTEGANPEQANPGETLR
jgi:hypothetical protein